MINIPIATITDTNVDSAIILNDNSDNIINTHANQIINQVAFLEVGQQYQPYSVTRQSPIIESGGNYDMNNPILNFSISTPHNNNSVSLTSTRALHHCGSDTTPNSEINNNNISSSNNYEGKLIIYFSLLFIFMIIILNKTL